MVFVSVISLIFSLGVSGFLFLENRELKNARPSRPQLTSELQDLAVFNNEELSCRNKKFKVEDLPNCPQGKGLFFLTRDFPPDTIFLGYLVGAGHHTLLQDVLRATRRMTPSPPVVVLVPQDEIQKVKKEVYAFLTPKYRKQVKFLLVPADYTTWVQDYFETVVDGESFLPSLLDLPYQSPGGDSIPGFLASVCDFDLVAQSEFQRKDKYVSGDYGGNIEALSDRLVIIGDSIHKDHLKDLKEQMAQEVVQVQVKWLDVGHVDELFSVIPGKGGEGNCPSKILYASPAEGWKLLTRRDPQFEERELALRWDGERELEEGFDLRSCFRKGAKNISCKMLFESNTTYEKSIQASIQAIKTAMKKHDTCAVPEFLPVPVLFSPKHMKSSYGLQEDEARAIDANPINNILLGNEAFVPRQAIPEFYRATKALFGSLRYQVRFVQGHFLHRQGGGIHCNVNVKRICKQALEKDPR